MKHTPSTVLLASITGLTSIQRARIQSLTERMEHLEIWENNPVEVYIQEVMVYSTFASAVIRYRRTDCEEYSPRMVACSGGCHFFVGRKGGTRLMGLYGLCPSDPAVVARLYRATNCVKASQQVIENRAAKARAAKTV